MFGLHSLERFWENMMQYFKGLTEVRGHHGSLLQIMESETLWETNDCKNVLIGKSFAIRAVNDWSMPPEKVAEAR